jgi:hypothetical protein
VNRDVLLKPSLNILLKPSYCARPKIIVFREHSMIHVTVNCAPAKAGDLLNLSEAKKLVHKRQKATSEKMTVNDKNQE